MPILLGKKSEQLKLIQSIRNEAHRFAINYHKQLRSNTFLISELDLIDGIGEKTRMKLINKYGSLEKIKKQTKNELINTIGIKRTNSLLQYIKSSIPKD